MEEKMEKNEKHPIVTDQSDYSLIMDTEKFNQLWRVSVLFSKSDMVPDQYKNKPENCMISIAMAIRLHVDPLMMLQTSYVVHGKPGIESKLAIALVNKSGTFTGPIRYRYNGEGPTRSCTAYATSKSSGEICEQTVTMEMARAEKWVDKAGSKWKTLPDLMLAYRSAMFLARLNCPEALMGMSTNEELEDIYGKRGEHDITNSAIDLNKTKATKVEFPDNTEGDSENGNE